MTSKFPFYDNSDPTFSFHDYSGTLKSFDDKTEEEWKNEMKNMEDIFGAEINVSSTFYLPLNHFILKRFHRVSAADLRLRHEFVILQCESKTGTFYLSFEKDLEGITVQYSKKEIEVKDKFKNKVRTQRDKLKEVDKKRFDFKGAVQIKLMGLGKLTVQNIVEEWKTALDYHFWTCNCQHLVNDVRGIFEKMSKKDAVKLKFPGSDKYVSLSLGNEKEIIALFNSYIEEYKNKEEKKHSLSISFPRVVGPIDDLEYNSEVDEKEMKDKIDCWIKTCLEEREVKGMYFTHLNENKMKENVGDQSLTEQSHDSIDLEEVWRVEIDGLILSEEYGAIIINVTNDNQNISENKKTVEEIFLKELFNTFYPDEIEVRNITIQLSNSGLEKPCKMISERCMQMDRGCEDKDEFCKLFKKLLKKTRKEQPYEKIEFLSGLLLILQNVEKADSKLFNCIINQELVTDCNYIVWSMQQKEMIDAMHIAFKEDPKDPKHSDNWDTDSLLKLIAGCPGSGKTLILLHAIDEYCKKWPKRNALFIVPETNTCLFEQVTSRFEKWRGLNENRVEIRSELPSIDKLNDLNVGFIAIDEFCHMEFLYGTDTSKSIERALKSGIHIWIATMDIRYKSMEVYYFNNIKRSHNHDKAYMFRGANYRSNKRILQLVHKLQESQEIKDIITVDKDLSSFMPVSGDAVNLLYMSENVLTTLDNGLASIEGDATPDRTPFRNACVNYILQNRSLLKKEKVLIYNICHYRLFLRIKKDVEDELSEELRNNLVFADARACQGAQYAYSIGIYDHSSVPYKPHSSIISALTRTVLSAHLLINLTTQYPSKTLVFDGIDGTSKLKDRLLYLRSNRENFTVLYSEDDSIDVAQIREIDNIEEIKVPFRPSARGQSWNDVDVVVGSSKFYANYRHAWSPIHSCNATFVVTCKVYERGNHDDQNKEIGDLLVNKFNQNN